MAIRSTLPNGVRVIFENNGESELAMTVGFRWGRTYEPRHMAGWAHLVEHLFYERSKNSEAFSADCVRYNMDFDAQTSSDMMMFTITASRRHFLKAAGVMIDLIFSHDFTDQDIQEVVGGILHEHGRGKDDFDEQLVVCRDRVIYGDHPLGHPVIGYRSNLERMTAVRFYQFWERLLDPRLIIVTVVGQVDRPRVRQLIRERFGHLTPPQQSLSRRISRPVYTGRRCLIRQLDSTQVYFAVTWPVPGYRSPFRLPLTILGRALAGHRCGIIYRALRRKGKAYVADSKVWFTPTIGHLTIDSDVSPDQFRQNLGIIISRLEQLRRFGLPQELFDLSVIDARHLANNRHRKSGREAKLLTSQLGVQNHLTDHLRFLARLQGVTLEQVNLALRRFLAADRARIAVLGPLTRRNREWLHRIFPGRAKPRLIASALTRRSA